MKYIPFCLILCLLMISCSSTPPAKPHEEVAPTESIATDAVQPEEVPALEEQTVQEGGDTSLEDLSLEDGSSEMFPTTDFLELKEDNLDDVLPLEETEYLQEIEIIDVDQQQAPFVDDLENMAIVIDDPQSMVVEPEIALVVETPAYEGVESIPEPLPQPDDEPALVVEEVVDTTVPDAGELESLLEPSLEQAVPAERLSEVESQAEAPIMEDESLLVEVEDAVVPEIVSQEQSDPQLEEFVPEEAVPIDVNAIQGVVTPVEPSRTIVMDNQQFLDLRYPGNGWVYLGEVTTEGLSIGTPNFTYFGRRRTSNDTNFTLRSIKSGSTILHFYKQDVLTATFIDDFVQVTITDTVAQTGSRVMAPNYDSVIPAYQDIIPQPSDYVQAAPTQEMPAAVEPETAIGSAPEVPESPVPSTSGMASAGPTSTMPVNPISAVAALPTTVDATNDGTRAAGDTTEPQALPLVAADTNRPATTLESPSTQPPVVETRPANASTTDTPSDTSTAAPASNQQAPVTGVVQADSQRLQEPVQNQVGALQIVPPRDAIPITSQSIQSQPDVSATRQQELHQPESASSTDSVPSNYNPQTGMAMEDLQLPWVQEELERQRTADIQQVGSAQAETESSKQQNQLERRLEEQDALLAKAQECFYAEDYPASLDYLNQFFAIAVNDFDAAYYLKGQVLESKSPVRNIKEAQKAYKHVVDSYPQSPFWKRAKNRFTYLSRFYFDIR